MPQPKPHRLTLPWAYREDRRVQQDFVILGKDFLGTVGPPSYYACLDRSGLIPEIVYLDGGTELPGGKLDANWLDGVGASLRYRESAHQQPRQACEQGT